jgi:Asp-tRNA(Asn)/Glu-tRNA(Gln) amidotransferase A subunit family amidase
VRTSTGSPIWNAVWSIFGVPTVTFPVGLTEDSLPTGVQLVGNFGDDDRLLAQAAWLEARVRGER